VRSFCTALKPPASPVAGRAAASGRSRPPPRTAHTTDTDTCDRRLFCDGLADYVRRDGLSSVERLRERSAQQPTIRHAQTIPGLVTQLAWRSAGRGGHSEGGASFGPEVDTSSGGR
jgi:hypothetical protein